MRRISFLVCVLLACVVSPQWLQAQISTFDATGPGTISGQGTFAWSINPSGTVTGFDRDANWVRHAFMRDSHGTITIIDAPGAGTCALPCGDVNNGPGTRAYSINAAGTIIGYYTASASGPARGFARSSGGTFTAIDAPDAGTSVNQGTYPGSVSGPYTINQAGAITGDYVDSHGKQHGFVRTTDGTITEFDPPNSSFTFPYAINQAGVIMGDYGDTVTGNIRGFLRDPDGTITAFDDPNAGTNGAQGQGTFPGGITASETLSGNYQDSSNVNHGFVGALGDFTTFDAPGAGTSAFQGTIVNSSNPSGAITGNYFDGSNVSHGFVRAKQGAITTFDAPGAGTSVNQGTFPVGINPSGAITGYYVDGSNVIHGFLRTR